MKTPVLFHTDLPDEAATLACGIALGQLAAGDLTAGKGLSVFLSGPLGAGKTGFSRGCLQGLGHPGSVKSPTYTLVEPYALASCQVYHFDLYRLKDPEELEFMGIRDYFGPGCLCLVEWPECGEPLLPEPDIWLHLSHRDSGRGLSAQAYSPLGQALLGRLREALC
jgi:tRNA threonylcarbamoyladenosine biosynthesis protein TsaE